MEDILEYEVEVKKPAVEKTTQKERSVSTDRSNVEASKTLQYKVGKIQAAKKWIPFGLGIILLTSWVSLNVANNLFVNEAIASTFIIGSLLFLKTLSTEEKVKV